MTKNSLKVSSCLRVLMTSTTCAIERESADMGLQVNEGKIKYKLSTNMDM